MRRTFLNRWLDAVLAGGVGLAGFAGLGLAEADAQTPADRYVAKQTFASPADASVARRGEIECALLADPLTFPYPIQPLFRDNTLELHGTVPSLAVRERILTIARLLHQGAISDHIVVELSSARRIRPLSASELRATILQRMHAVFPQQVAHIQVLCDERGNVTLSGSVPTWTEKRSIHQTLRDTPGCASMTNRLTLTATAPNTPIPTEGILQAGGVESTSGLVPAGGFSQPREPNLLESQQLADSMMRIEDSILHQCPQVKNLHVVQVEPKRYRIEFDAPDPQTGDLCVRRIFSMDELRRVQIDVLVNTPKH
jgi:hypothetical protein